jgi:hypothetical protein
VWTKTADEILDNLARYLRLVNDSGYWELGVAELCTFTGRVSDDLCRRRRLGQAGRERVQAVLAWEQSAPVLLAAYDRLWSTLGRGRITYGTARSRTPP